MNYIYELAFTVRDYECDLQGIVNNAVYQNYLEHARHEFLKTIGLDFKQMHDEGLDAVVVKAELNYKAPLTSGDAFVVRLNLQQQGSLRFVFHQDIYRSSDDKLMVQAQITGVCLKNDRPVVPDQLMNAVKRVQSQAS